jgi:hypothetical protein
LSLAQIRHPRHPTFSTCMDTLNNGVSFLFVPFVSFSRQKETGPEIHARYKCYFDIIFRQKKREPTPTDSQKEKTHKGPFAIFSRPLIESEIKSEKKSEIEKRKSEIKLAII